jgi:hypothetical protein
MTDTQFDNLIEAIALNTESAGTNYSVRDYACKIRALKTSETYPEEPDAKMGGKRIGTLTMTMNTKETKIVEPAEHHSWAWWEAWLNKIKLTWTWTSLEHVAEMLADWKDDREDLGQWRQTEIAARDLADAEVKRVRKIAHELVTSITSGEGWTPNALVRTNAEIDGKEGT